MARRAARVDANQASITAALRKAGASVQLLHSQGRGCPDALVGYRGRNYLLELKHGKGKTNALQDAWILGWRGQVALAYSADAALRVIGAIK